MCCNELFFFITIMMMMIIICVVVLYIPLKLSLNHCSLSVVIYFSSTPEQHKTKETKQQQRKKIVPTKLFGSRQDGI